VNDNQRVREPVHSFGVGHAGSTDIVSRFRGMATIMRERSARNRRRSPFCGDSSHWTFLAEN
jgi:hypothetical protein